MRGSRLLFALLAAVVIAGGPVVHIVQHLAAGTAGARPAAHCGYCVAHAHHTVAAAASPLPLPFTLAADLHPAHAAAPAWFVVRASDCRAPPLA